MKEEGRGLLLNKKPNNHKALLADYLVEKTNYLKNAHKKTQKNPFSQKKARRRESSPVTSTALVSSSCVSASLAFTKNLVLTCMYPHYAF